MTSLQKFLAKIDNINNQGRGEVFDKSEEPLLEIPFALPDEIIEYVNDDSGNASFINFNVISPHRTEPVCPQFKKCGGCSLQHASETFVTEWKKSVVVRALEQKKLYPKFRNTYVAPERSRRRAVFSGRRTKKGTVVGFKSPRSDNIVSIFGCIIIDKKILSFLPGMQKITALACTRSSTIKIHTSISENGLDIFVESGRKLDKALRIDITSVAIKYNLARLSWDGEQIFLSKPPVQRIGKIQIFPPEKFFMQATKEAEIIMVRDVCEALSNAKNIVDLFSGFGTFSIPLSHTKKILAFEQSAEMLSSLDSAWRRTSELKVIKTSIRNLFKNPVSVEELSDIDGAVVNPPRSGSSAQCKELAKSSIPTIVLVSCNPTTFARDAEILVKGFYVVDWVRVIDQFRWSHHVEVIGKFSRRPEFTN